VAFLKDALEVARHGQQFAARNPEFHAVGAQIVQLYEDIVTKAVEKRTAHLMPCISRPA
jgi:hypothetical protein